MGGRPVIGSLAGVATRASRGGGIWGEERVDRWAPSVSDGRTVMAGWQAGSHAEMGRGWRRGGSAMEKTAHEGFSILNPFSN
jgi:hypothetical protein